jgi:hypothetical protein
MCHRHCSAELREGLMEGWTIQRHAVRPPSVRCVTPPLVRPPASTDPPSARSSALLQTCSRFDRVFTSLQAQDYKPTIAATSPRENLPHGCATPTPVLGRCRRVAGCV